MVASVVGILLSPCTGITAWWEKKDPILLKNIRYILCFFLVFSSFLCFSDPNDRIYLCHALIIAKYCIPMQKLVPSWLTSLALSYMSINPLQGLIPPAVAQLAQQQENQIVPPDLEGGALEGGDLARDGHQLWWVPVPHAPGPANNPAEPQPDATPPHPPEEHPAAPQPDVTPPHPPEEQSPFSSFLDFFSSFF